MFSSVWFWDKEVSIHISFRVWGRYFRASSKSFGQYSRRETNNESLKTVRAFSEPQSNRQAHKPTSRKENPSRSYQMPEKVPVVTHGFLAAAQVFKFARWSSLSETKQTYKLEILNPNFFCKESRGFSWGMFKPSSNFMQCLFVQRSKFWFGSSLSNNNTFF
jgi:hypothetical protein